jgi:hypothetical protein
MKLNNIFSIILQILLVPNLFSKLIKKYGYFTFNSWFNLCVLLGLIGSFACLRTRFKLDRISASVFTDAVPVIVDFRIACCNLLLSILDYKFRHKAQKVWR